MNDGIKDTRLGQICRHIKLLRRQTTGVILETTFFGLGAAQNKHFRKKLIFDSSHTLYYENAKNVIKIYNFRTVVIH